jgi:gliding motility-associated-like protein
MKFVKTIFLFLLIMTVFSQSNQKLDICVEDSRHEYTYSVNSDTPNTIFYWYVDGVYHFGQTLTIDWSTYQPGEHTITVYGISNDCSSLPVTYKVFIDECSSIYIPNAFTPNDDGINDGWYPIGVGWEWIEVLIFDRWGILVFSSTKIKDSWIGNFRNGGYYVQNDVYEYKVTWKGVNKEPEIIFGHVTLIR